MEQHTSPTSHRKNPSRETCEKTIKRILMTEVLEHGQNLHFRSASDFMNYFESLYPASDALTKQVQRAIKALDMPKDEKGYFIVNKTVAQQEEDREIKSALDKSCATCVDMSDAECVFLKVPSYLQEYLIHLLTASTSFDGKILTISKTYNGLMIYTDNARNLMILINSLTI